MQRDKIVGRKLSAFVVRSRITAYVWFYHNIVIDLGTDIVHPDGIRLFVGYIDDIGLIMIHRLFTGAA